MTGVGNVGGGGAWQAMSTQLHALENANQGKGDKHVRGTTNGTPIYVHGDQRHGIGSRQPKYQEGVRQIKAALDQEFGAGFGDFAFKQLGKSKGFFSVSPEKGLKLKDIGKLDQIVADYGAKHQAVRNDPMFQTMGAQTFFKLLGDVEKCIGKASPQAQLDANQLTDLQKVAIHGYTCTDTCYALNRMLREAGGDRSGLSPYGQAYIQHIEDGLNALPRPNPNDYDSFNDNGNSRVMVYRGAKHLPTSVDQGFQAGKRVTEHAFTSTSASSDKNFHGSFQFSILLSGQTTGRDVSAFSPHDEQEVLFPPGTRFDVVSRHGDADILGIGMEASTGVDIVMRERVGG
jgi:hypothetical protein